MKKLFVTLSFIITVIASSLAQDWSTTGNFGITPGNFLGAKDGHVLNFKVNDTLAGSINESLRHVFLGYKAGFSNGGSFGNTMIGHEAGLNTTSGNNTFVGYQAGQATTQGTQSVYFGAFAGMSATTGSQNAIFGFQAGKFSTGGSNTLMGESAGLNMTTGDNNVMVGKSAGLFMTTGSNNVFIGRNVVNALTTGSSNVIIGQAASAGSARTNGIAIGNGVTLSRDNCAVIGNSSVTKFGIGKTPVAANIMEFQVTTAKLTTGGVWTNASDIKLKDNITQLNRQEILDKINQLEVARWHYKADVDPVTHIGPFAKDFYEAFGTGDDYTISTIDPSGVALIGIQQLSTENNALKNEIQNQQAEIETLKKQVLEMQKCMETVCALTEKSASSSSLNIPAGILFQNSPNPFNGKTVIKYQINSDFHTATMLVRNLHGQLMREVKLAGGRSGEIELGAAALAAGTYTYTLEVDGKSIDTKLMILTGK